MNLTTSDLLAVMALNGAVLSGWNLYIQSKLRAVNVCFEKLDDLQDKFNQYKLDVLREFATKDEVGKAVDKLDSHIEDVRRSVDRLRETIERKHGA